MVRGIDTEPLRWRLWRCSFDLRLQYEEGSHYSAEDDPADSSAATETPTPRFGVGREMPSFFIL